MAAASKKRVGLIGFPVEHSVSPTMHNAAFKALNFPYEFELLPIPPEDLKDFVRKLRGTDWLGVNVTIPHKEAILPLLDELLDETQKIGAINTIQNDQGILKGSNTDGRGFLQSLWKDMRFEPGGKKAVILGAGGAARSITYSLCQAGIRRVTLINRSPQRANQISQNIQRQFSIEVSTLPISSPTLSTVIQAADLIVNTTPVGMYPDLLQSPLPTTVVFRPNQLVCDIIFNPLETEFLKSARNFGAKILGGLGMLVYQGALSFEIFTGQQPPVEVMRKAAEEVLRLSSRA